VPLDARSAENRTRETNAGNFIADAFRRALGADVALLNGGSIRADELIAPGQLTLREAVEGRIKRLDVVKKSEPDCK